MIINTAKSNYSKVLFSWKILTHLEVCRFNVENFKVSTCDVLFTNQLNRLFNHEWS
jgi:hypothetical protein